MRFDPARLRLEADGAERFLGAATPLLASIDAFLADVATDIAGIRLQDLDGLPALLEDHSPVRSLAVERLGSGCRAVRAIVFDKSVDTNWSLAWHQDRTIAVVQRRDVPGFGPWTVKAGMLHVAPSPEILASMLTMRIHLDPVPDTNAPLLIAPGSHRYGRIAEREIEGVVAKCGTALCTAERGDI